MKTITEAMNLNRTKRGVLMLGCSLATALAQTNSPQRFYSIKLGPPLP